MKVIMASSQHVNFVSWLAKKNKLVSFPSWLYKLLIISFIGKVFIVLYRDRPAGFLLAIPLIGSMVYVHQIGISPNLQKKGLGTFLLKNACKRLSSEFKSVVLSVRNSNRTAKRWYHKFGFSKCNRINRFVWKPILSQTLLKVTLRKR